MMLAEDAHGSDGSRTMVRSNSSSSERQLSLADDMTKPLRQASEAGPSQATKVFAVKAAMVASIGGLLFGYDIGVIAGALQELSDEMDLNHIEQGLVVSILYIGYVLGSLAGGWVTDRIGRKLTIICVDLVFIVGTLLLTFAQNLGTIYAGRFIVGIGVAVSAIADVAYLTEIAPFRYRGMSVSVNEFMITVGILAAFICNLAFAHMKDGWRFMFATAGIFAVLQLLLMLPMPRSPRWLYTRHRLPEAKQALAVIYGSAEEIAQEERRIEETVRAASEISSSTSKSLFQEWRFAIYVSVGLMFAQQFSGHANILSYAPMIFEDSGAGRHGALIATVILGSVKVVMTGVSLYWIDRLGRRPLLIYGVAVMCGSLGVLCLAFALPKGGGTPILLAGCCIFVAAYATSYGPVTWLVSSEMFPSSLRGRALGLATVANGVGSVLVSFSFLPLNDLMGPIGTFAMYAAICALALGLIYLYVPETKEREAAEIYENLQLMIAHSALCCASESAYQEIGSPTARSPSHRKLSRSQRSDATSRDEENARQGLGLVS